ncbi:uroporphyrinogen-III synthase [Paenibacillus methanolicus]|uniref:Uroporphyrinogen-III synthase n=1 Tax=Paenibacillus methanolicus TaxID=582686 RepID=A0A5S5CAC2_9BACL|nr:uroporphyrinogen-III synthase [Paenibacillus methanolicus]TYP75578.1 uroporphyrinogen-III synthase [Paenibacillus methanolicus]
MSKLEGVTIAVTGPRKADEISRMIEKFGGRAVIRPTQGTVFLDDTRLEGQLERLIDQPPDWIILTTGVGTEALLQAAESLGKREAFIGMLGRTRIAARGYKTVNALRKLGLAPLVKDDDGTTAGLLREMEPHDLAGASVALQLYGDPAPKIIGRLVERGAACEEILPYRHIPPEGDGVEAFIEEIIAGGIDAVAATSTPQVRYLMQKADESGRLAALKAAFEGPVLAVAVGKVTAESFAEEGISRVLYPEEERMGSMVVAMTKYFDRQTSKESAD